MNKISIIIPMFNVAHYLEKCVDSVFKQNLDPTDFEIIMINDGSPDDSLKVAKKIASRNPSIKIFSQENKGLGGARNTGIKNARGKYLIFLDADDSLLPNSIQLLIEIADENELDILEFGANIVTEKGVILHSVSKDSNNKTYNGIEYYNTIKYSGSACNKLYSNALLQKSNLFFLEKIYGEDFEFNTRAFFKAKKVMAIDTVCAAFLQSPNSITRNNDKKIKDKYLLDFIKILSSISDFKDKKKTTNRNDAIDTFFNERLTMVNINAFYLMFKNNYSFNDMQAYKEKLIRKKLYHVMFSVSIKKKELFRSIMLNNFFLFRITQPVKRYWAHFSGN